MKNNTAGNTRTNAGLVCLAVLAAVVAVLFRGSFVPGQLAFANDAPFGLMDAFSELRWSHFWRGAWVQANWVGSEVLPLQPSFTHLWFLVGGSVFFNKFIGPLSLLFFGFSAYVFGRSQKFSHWVAGLMGIAAALNGDILSHACWGLGGRAVYLGFFLLAAAAVGRSVAGGRAWLRLIPAGLCIGLVVVEGADTGAIQSVYFAAFLFFHEWVSTAGKPRALATAAAKLTVIVAVSALVSALALSSLVGTQIQGVAGTAQDEATRQKRWEFATGWSYPPAEVTRFAVPGIKGYRMDTPEGGNYWGDVGSDGSPPRFSGGGEYAGILVLLMAAWAVARAAVGRAGEAGQPFDTRERRLIGFWAVASFLSLLFAFGHFAPFYRLLYQLPYFSTIRIPMKFLHPMHLGLIVLFGYGLEGLRRNHLGGNAPWGGGLVERIASWWRGAKGFERGWRNGLMLVVVAGVVAATVYGSSTAALTKTLARTPGIDAAEAPVIAAFSVREVWISVGFLAAYGAILAAVAAGHWAGREKAAMLTLGVVLTADLYRASVPWVQHYDYERRYQSNVVIDLLRTNASEGRMTARISPRLRAGFTRPRDGTFPAVLNQWLEHHFQKFRVQTLDIIQMSRVPQLDEDFLVAFEPSNPGIAQAMAGYALELPNLEPDQAAQVRQLLAAAGPTNFPVMRRLWELTNTRYIVGAGGLSEFLNAQFDPQQRRFSNRLEFGLSLKPDSAAIRNPTLDDITAVAQPGGGYSVVEFTGALPRAKFFTRWQTETNTATALSRLVDPRFDPQAEVILADDIGSPPSSPDPAAKATIESWLPRDQVVRTRSGQPGVMLLVQRWHPDWKATVDGKPVPLLRANHLFSGVAVPAGEHVVELHYQPSRPALWITLAAMAAGAVSLLLLARAGPVSAEE